MKPMTIEDFEKLLNEAGQLTGPDDPKMISVRVWDLHALVGAVRYLTGPEPVKVPPFEEKVSMIYLNGRDKPSFRCACGANVFTEYAPAKYRCNGCQDLYNAE